MTSGLLLRVGGALTLAASTLVAQSIPAALGVPRPGHDAPVGQPYAPQPVLQGGIVLALYPPDSPQLNKERMHEAEKYTETEGSPGRIGTVVNIHNPSIEVHTVGGAKNTGAAVILAAGGAQRFLSISGEGTDFEALFYNLGVNTIILRNRLRSDGYEPRTDGVRDVLQAVRLVRKNAAALGIDPNKIGVMGFSAGAELASGAAIQFPQFDERNNEPGDPLAGISARADFFGIIYPGPTPFARGESPEVPRSVPPSFIATAGSGDRNHAIWAMEYFNAMLQLGAPNIEMHIYGTGRHPTSGADGGWTDREGVPFGTWHVRFIDWFRDLGFLEAPGVATRAAAESQEFVNAPPRPQRRPGGPGPGGPAPGGPGN